MLSRGGGRGRPAESSSFELFAWYSMRVSGLLLIFLAILHVVIMHVVNTVDEIDWQFVADRWSSPFWQVYDFLLLVLAVLHGVNGARISVNDYIRSDGWRTAAITSLWLIAFVLLVVGGMAIVTFDPAAFEAAQTGG